MTSGFKDLDPLTLSGFQFKLIKQSVFPDVVKKIF
jgi:hypothetical protein